MYSYDINKFWDNVIFPSKYYRTHCQEVKLLISNKCNLNCIYCPVDKCAEDNLPKEFNSDVIEFLNRLCTNGNTVVNFMSGEPLLFLDVIEEFCRLFPDRRKFMPFITTNGYFLTEKNIKKLNDLNMRVSISHEGENTLLTRGYDVVEDKKSLILKLDNFCGFSAVQTELSWNLYDLHSYYCKHFLDLKFQRFSLHKVKQRTDKYSLGEIDSDSLDKMWSTIVDRCISSSNPLNTLEFQWIKPEIDNFLYYQLNKEHGKYPLKADKDLRINIDLNGNWYYSWFYPDKIGTVNSSLEEIRKNYRNLLPKYWNNCGSCEAYDICNEGHFGEIKSDALCNYNRIIYKNIFPLLSSDIVVNYILANNVNGNQTLYI